MATNRTIYEKGGLTARPKKLVETLNFSVGLQALALAGQRDGLLYVPKEYHPTRPAALLVMLHGAGGNALQGMALLRDLADHHNLILLAPESRQSSWDIIAMNHFGEDVIFIDQALSLVFERYCIDTSCMGIGGFSDGASYALCLGLSNGDLFTHVLAYSPGFVITKAKIGTPDLFISHGVNDRVLPIEPCSRRLVPRLKALGYSIQYREFIGAHEVPVDIVESSLAWFIHT